MSNNRMKRVEVRLSNAEHSVMLARRGKMRLAAWMRHTCIQGIPPTIPTINQDALGELHRIGSNLNQIAKAINSGDAADLNSLRQQVSALRLALIEAVK